MIDPIVEEVRKLRSEHARSFQFDIHAICLDLRRIEDTCGHEVVNLVPQRLRPVTERFTCAEKTWSP